MARFTRKDFLDALFQDYFRDREGFIMVKSSRPSDLKTSIRYFPNTEILAKEPYQHDQHVFFGVCPHEKMRAEKSHIHYFVALWAGLDLDPEGYCGRQTHFFGQAQAAKAIRSFPLPPSIVVESGRGVHLYWLLKNVTPAADVEAVERLLGKINSYFQCKTEVGIDSMLRLPDTSNLKVSAAPTECRVKYLNPDFRYDVSELAQLNLRATVSPGKSAQVAPPAKSMPDAAVLTRPEPAEPDFEPEPYEGVGKKPSVFPEPRSVGAASAEALDRVADKLADKITEKIAAKLVDQIVDKVVARLKALR